MNFQTPILIVDDHQTMRKSIAFILRDLGFNNLFYAEDGEMAWELMQDEQIGLLLLDWNMPRMTGIELLQKIRNSEEYSNLPVLMVTAEAHENLVLEAIYRGVTGYIVKPFTAYTLENKIKALLSSRK